MEVGCNPARTALLEIRQQTISQVKPALFPVKSTSAVILGYDALCIPRILRDLGRVRPTQPHDPPRVCPVCIHFQDVAIVRPSLR